MKPKEIENVYGDVNRISHQYKSRNSAYSNVYSSRSSESSEEALSLGITYQNDPEKDDKN